MNLYRVLITRNCTESTYVDTTARSRAHAQEKALHEAQDFPERFPWTRDDGSGDSDLPYLADDALECVEKLEVENSK
jgi:hypothetical protein